MKFSNIPAVGFATCLAILSNSGFRNDLSHAAAIERSGYETVSIMGSVVDRTGAVIVNARVTLCRRDQKDPIGQSRTNTKGEFIFEDLGPQRFELTVEADGFRRRKTRIGTKSPGLVRLPPVRLENLGIVFDNPPG